MKIKPIILCGGEGTRLWPESRKKHPKQFIKINGKSLLKHAIDRVTGVNFDSITICSNANFLDQIKEETKNINCKIFVEPDKKNTAAAILAAINDDDLISLNNLWKKMKENKNNENKKTFDRRFILCQTKKSRANSAIAMESELENTKNGNQK